MNNLYVLLVTDSYEAARKDLPRALEDSDLNSETEELTRFRLRPTHNVTKRKDDAFSDEEDNVGSTGKNVRKEMPPPPPPPSSFSITPNSSNIGQPRRNAKVKRSLFQSSSLEASESASVQPSHYLGLVSHVEDSQEVLIPGDDLTSNVPADYSVSTVPVPVANLPTKEAPNTQAEVSSGRPGSK